MVDHKNEEWRAIKGYEGLYEVSNTGKIRNYNRRKELSLKKDKYLRVGLHKNNKQKFLTVHRLVAEAFLSNPQNLPQVNHKDENKLNNNVDNLEWCSAKYNINYGTHKNRVSKTLKEKNTAKYGIPVKAISLTDGEELTFPSVCEAARQLNLRSGCITNVIKGRTSKTGKYKFVLL